LWGFHRIEVADLAGERMFLVPSEMISRRTSQNGQNHSRRVFADWCIGAGVTVLMAILAMAVFFFGRNEPHASAPETAVEIGSPPKQSSGVSSDSISLERESEAPSSDAATPAANVRDPSVAELENSFRITKEPKTRVEIAKQIAGFNDAAAVESLARLFYHQSHPADKEALLAALGDIDPREALEVRLRLLASALHGEARNVRLAALSLLDELDDSRGAELICDVMKNDPDRQVRDVATAILRERADDATP